MSNGDESSDISMYKKDMYKELDEYYLLKYKEKKINEAYADGDVKYIYSEIVTKEDFILVSERIEKGNESIIRYLLYDREPCRLINATIIWKNLHEYQELYTGKEAEMLDFEGRNIFSCWMLTLTRNFEIKKFDTHIKVLNIEKTLNRRCFKVYVKTKKYEAVLWIDIKRRILVKGIYKFPEARYEKILVNDFTNEKIIGFPFKVGDEFKYKIEVYKKGEKISIWNETYKISKAINNTYFVEKVDEVLILKPSKDYLTIREKLLYDATGSLKKIKSEIDNKVLEGKEVEMYEITRRPIFFSSWMLNLTKDFKMKKYSTTIKVLGIEKVQNKYCFKVLIKSKSFYGTFWIDIKKRFLVKAEYVYYPNTDFELYHKLILIDG